MVVTNARDEKADATYGFTVGYKQDIGMHYMALSLTLHEVRLFVPMFSGL